MKEAIEHLGHCCARRRSMLGIRPRVIYSGPLAAGALGAGFMHAGLICHLGFIVEGQPYVISTIHAWLVAREKTTAGRTDLTGAETLDR